uniref:Colipase n=1 Tax=Lynx canadensis TaxID=61383 RepID=A0A667G5C1_LYNCA
MEKVLVLLLVALAVAYAVPDPRGIIIHLEDGELCLNSLQCKSKCCHRDTGLSLARCAPKASENSECSAKVGARGVGAVVAGRGTAQRRRALRLGDRIAEERQPGP